MGASQKHGVVETIDLTEQNFDETLLATPGLVMVDFWAEWCGPCRAIAPILEELVEASDGRVTLMKVNVDKHPGLAARHNIRSIPTILFFRDGALVDRVIGAAPKAVLQDVLQGVIMLRKVQ
jgi:thioredoxin 1